MVARSAQELIEELRKAGVVLALSGGSLRARAPSGVVTPALREAIAARRKEIVRILQAEERAASGEAATPSLVSLLFTPPVQPLERGATYSLGRDATCSFRLPSEDVSRRHAEIAWVEGAGFEIRDLGSKNGTAVNKARIERHLLRDGDRIQIGPFRLAFREMRPAALRAAASASFDGNETAAIPSGALAGGAPAPPRPGFSGTFDGPDLFQVCQLIVVNQRTGTLAIDGEKVSGFIQFDRGDIVGARAGEAEGRRAALDLLSITSGWFEFAPETVGPIDAAAPRIHAGGVLIEAARRRDEWEDLVAILGPEK